MDKDGIAALFVAPSLGLLMTNSVTLANVEIFAEPHKGTRGGPCARLGAAESRLQAAGLPNSAMSSAPGWSPIQGFLVRRSPRT